MPHCDLGTFLLPGRGTVDGPRGKNRLTAMLGNHDDPINGQLLPEAPRRRLISRKRKASKRGRRIQRAALIRGLEEDKDDDRMVALTGWRETVNGFTVEQSLSNSRIGRRATKY